MVLSNEQYLVSLENDITRFALLGHIGDREEQQDACGYNMTNDSLFVTVCDGMGGHSCGRQASIYACEQLTDFVDEFLSDSDPSTRMVEISREIDQSIGNSCDENGNRLQAGTTTASVLISKNELYWLSVGDSRVYIFRAGQFVQVTEDHVYRVALRENMERGLISEDFVNQEKMKSDVLISFLGHGEMPLIDTNSTPFVLQPNDMILVMSDGVYKHMSDAEMMKIIESTNDVSIIAETFEQTIRRSSGHLDNFTIAVIQFK